MEKCLDKFLKMFENTYLIGITIKDNIYIYEDEEKVRTNNESDQKDHK